MVTVTSLSPQPACQTETVEYDCQINFTEKISLLRWKFNGYDTLFFTNDNKTGSITNSTDDKISANLTLNERMEENYIKASTLTIRPPLNKSLNGTNVTCEGVGESDGVGENETITDNNTLQLKGE